MIHEDPLTELNVKCFFGHSGAVETSYNTTLTHSIITFQVDMVSQNQNQTDAYLHIQQIQSSIIIIKPCLCPPKENKHIL